MSEIFLFDVVRLLRVSSDHGALLLHRSRDGRAMNRRRALRHRRRRRRVLLLERRPAAVALRAAPASGRRPEALHRLVEAGAALDGGERCLFVVWYTMTNKLDSMVNSPWSTSITNNDQDSSSDSNSCLFDLVNGLYLIDSCLIEKAFKLY